jgi:F-type H+-transporting ATPase subunit b
MGSSLISPEPGTILWTVITFVILAFLLGRFAWKPLLQVLEEREESIREALDGSQKARAEAEELLRKNKEILTTARRETAAIIEQGRRESDTLRSEILSRARKEAQDLVEQGKRQVQHEQKQAIVELRQQVADVAIQAAERLIEESLDDTRHRDLVNGYIDSLATLGADNKQS